MWTIQMVLRDMCQENKNNHRRYCRNCADNKFIIIIIIIVIIMIMYVLISLHFLRKFVQFVLSKICFFYNDAFSCKRYKIKQVKDFPMTLLTISICHSNSFTWGICGYLVDEYIKLKSFHPITFGTRVTITIRNKARLTYN
jgi:hypothetical protein